MGAAVVIASTLLPWWENTGALALKTQSPKGVLAGSALVLISGVIAARGPWEPLWAIGPIATFATGVSLVSFVLRVDDGGFFPDKPFTVNVDFGFFVALLGFGWVVLSGVVIVVTALTDERPPSGWIGPSVGLLIVAALVGSSYNWTSQSRERITEGPTFPGVPEATVGPRPSSPK